MDKIFLRLESLRDLKEEELGLEGDSPGEYFPRFLYDDGSALLAEYDKRVDAHHDKLLGRNVNTHH